MGLSMSKNTPQELLDEGFAPEQFGQDATTWPIYAQAVLDEQNQIAQDRTATQYTSTDAGIQNHIKRAERFLTVSELWDRRAARVDAESSVGQDNQQAELTRFARNAEKATQKAEHEFAQIPTVTSTSDSASSAAAFGAETSSHFKGSGYSRNSLAGIGGVI